MAADLQPGHFNNINVVTIRTCGSSLQRSTDRPVDLTGDGNEETGRSQVMDSTVEPDGGVNTTGSEFTEGNQS
jgi:hypothetical protein